MSSATISSIRRSIRAQRQACSDYENETARLKQEAERSTSDPAAASQLRFLVDIARGAVFQKMRDNLRNTEAQLAVWSRSDRSKIAPKSFGALVASSLRKPVAKGTGK